MASLLELNESDHSKGFDFRNCLFQTLYWYKASISGVLWLVHEANSADSYHSSARTPSIHAQQ